jgi:hypothetical protein
VWVLTRRKTLRALLKHYPAHTRARVRVRVSTNMCVRIKRIKHKTVYDDNTTMLLVGIFRNWILPEVMISKEHCRRS